MHKTGEYDLKIRIRKHFWNNNNAEGKAGNEKKQQCSGIKIYGIFLISASSGVQKYKNSLLSPMYGNCC